MKTAQVLVLFSYRSHPKGYIEKLFGRLSEAAEAQSLELSRGSLKDLHIRISDNQLAITESLTGRDLREYDLVYFELWRKAQQQAYAAATYCQRYKIPFFSQEMLAIMPSSKIAQLAQLADNDIWLPDTFVSSHREIKKIFTAKLPISFPIIVKASEAYGGKNNYLVQSQDELIAVLTTNKELEFVIQEYIPNDCDYRCLVMGGRIRLVLKRARADTVTSHLNNTSRGAEGKVVPLDSLSKTAQDMALRAAQLLGREDFCGVDLMLHRDTNKPYILEVNQTPQIEIGVEIDTKMKTLLDYMQERVRGRQDDGS